MAVGIPSSLTSWLPRILLLLAIWGTAVFLWGTFGAWTYNQYTANERRMAEANTVRVAEWLKLAIDPLDSLAADPRLAQGMELPAGVESLPVQRVLYEFGYLTRQTEVYIVDLMRKRVGKTAGAAPLSAEITERLAGMDDSERMVMGMGSRNGQMMLIRKVKTALPDRLVVMVPVSLGTLATNYPTPNLPENRTLGIVVPHANGWAEWRGGGQGFVLDEALSTAVEAGAASYEAPPWIKMLIPLPGWNGVMLDLQSPDAVTGARLLPQLLVALWAIVMSVLVLWNAGQHFRKKAAAALHPVLTPLDKIIVPINTLVHSIRDAISARWNAANEDVPLVDGPGAFGKDDFVTADEQAARSGQLRKSRGLGKPMNLTQSAPAIVAKRPAKPLVERRKRERPTMAWPEKTGELQPKHIPLAKDEADSDSLLDIVKECLRKKRVKLLYQAIYRADDNMPMMHEVYARLVKENGEVIPPNEFMPIVLKHKLALELDIAVLRKVVNEHFINNGVPMTPLALNISSTSLDGIAYLQEMTAQGPRVLQKISFEVRSQEMIRDPKALRLLKDLQKHGGNLAVDYFGGGNAMLDASIAMGFNYVKLNCSKFMESDDGKKEIITMCQHARSAGLPIILEMIGDADVLAFARKTGAEFLQGYALARPAEVMTATPLAPDLG